MSTEKIKEQLRIGNKIGPAPIKKKEDEHKKYRSEALRKAMVKHENSESHSQERKEEKK